MRPDRPAEPSPSPSPLSPPSPLAGARSPTPATPGVAVADAGPDDPRLPAIAGDVARRLRAVCAGMPPDAFDALVLDIARFRLRWQDREGGTRG